MGCDECFLMKATQLMRCRRYGRAQQAAEEDPRERSSKKERKGNALASGAEEGRDKLR